MPTPCPAAARRTAPLARLAAAAVAATCTGLAAAADGANLPSVGPVPVDFILFGLTLLGVALFHHHTLKVALAGLFTITAYKVLFTGFKEGPGIGGFASHLAHEWVTLTNLFLLLMGFALLSRHFEKSRVPLVLPRYLPADWRGCFALLVMVFVISSFLDNIAAALIGGAMAHQLFRAKVHIGFLAAIVAASNAGGSGSVIGDTTTTMMWIAGVRPGQVFEAYVGAVTAMLVFGIPAARQQHAYSPMIHHAREDVAVDWVRLFIVINMLVGAIGANVLVNVLVPQFADLFPYIGVAVWIALISTIPARRPDWEVLPETLKGTLFLLSLVLCASMMPVERLPAASWQTAMGLGFVSAVFDNIPLTALALKQGGYDWGFVAYAVGFGGSMIWFGSSAGVALSNQFPEARSAINWLRQGWHVALGYVVGFLVLLFVLGFHPDAPVTGQPAQPTPTSSVAPAVTAPWSTMGAGA
ncbi:MAG: citrate transporter [Burkholderiales bacterium]